jgi:hypothetical protein
MYITGKQVQTITIEISEKDLAYSIMDVIQKRLGNIDDAGCDWMTKGDETFIGNDLNWKVSSDYKIARLVDAMNILLYGAMIRDYHE